MNRVRSKYTDPDYHYTCFTVGGYECCISLKSVREIARGAGVMRRNDLPDFVHGVIPLRTVNIPVVDMRRRFDLIPAVKGMGMVIVVGISDRVVGLLVDLVTGVTTGSKEIRPKDPDADGLPFDAFIEVVLETESGLVRVVSPESLFTPEEIGVLTGGLPDAGSTAHGW